MIGASGRDEEGRRVRILNLLSSSGLFGAERVALELAHTLKGSFGEEPVIGVMRNSLSPHTEVGEEAERLGIETITFGCDGQFDRKTISTIRRYISGSGIDILHCHGYKSNFYGYLASRGLVPAIATNHNWIRSHWKLRLYCFIDSRFIIRRFDSVVAVSEDIKNEMAGRGIPGEKMRVIDNGVDMQRFMGRGRSPGLRKSLGMGSSAVVIGTAGSLKPVKGHGILLRAAREVLDSTDKDIRFLIVGGGELEKDLMDEARELVLEERVVFTGYRKDVEDLLSCLDIFVLPSLREGLPMVVLEAMASGKPVVATRVGAVPRVVEGGGCGLIVEPGDAGALASALMELVEDKEKRGAMGRRGRDEVVRAYSSVSMAERYLDLYRELVPRLARGGGTSRGSKGKKMKKKISRGR